MTVPELFNRDACPRCRARAVRAVVALRRGYRAACSGCGGRREVMVPRVGGIGRAPLPDAVPVRLDEIAGARRGA